MSDKTAYKRNEPNEETEPPAGNGRRRFAFVTRRRLAYAAGGTGVILLLFVIILTVLYRTGAIDNYVKEQFVRAFDEMGIGFASDRFAVEVSPLAMKIEKAVFVNKKTGERLGSVERAYFDLTILDLFALRTEREINIDSTEIYGLEVLFTFDENGRSNFEGIEFMPPKNRIKFRYNSARVSVRNSVVRFGDESRSISGDAEDLAMALEPAPSDSEPSALRYGFDISTSRAEFSYGKETVEPISVRGRGFLTEEGFDIGLLTVSSELGTSSLSGKVTGWDTLAYDLRIVSDIDMSQASRVFPLGTAVTGTGGFAGRVSGSGENWKIEGEITSESLAASNVRLKALQVNGSADGEGSLYRASGKAIAELLTFGDVRLDYPQLTGSIRGTGTDFRWFGALEAAALKSPLGTIGSLYINDAAAEYRDNKLIATLNGASARKFTSEDAYLESIQTPSIRIVSSGGLTTAEVDSASAARLDVQDATLGGVAVAELSVTATDGSTGIEAGRVNVDRIDTRDARLNNVSANSVTVNRKDGRTSISARSIEAENANTSAARIGKVEANDVKVEVASDRTMIDSPVMRIARVETDSAVLANLNIAGVRLTVRQGVIEGTTADFEPGTVDLKEHGRLERVAVYRPVFVLEPSGRYRASLDLTLGGGLVGSVDLGAARASVVADNDKIILKDIDAEVLNGRLNGSATVALDESVNSTVDAAFTDLDIGKLLTLQSGNVIPVEGRTSGTADLTFAGTDLRRASGAVSATLTATAGNDERGFLPLAGELEATAADGLVTFTTAEIGSGSSYLTALGELDLFRDRSDLDVAVNSSDASEVERVVRIFEISPQLREQLDTFEASFAGNFSFDGKVTGNVENPDLRGRASLDSLIARSRPLGSLSLQLDLTESGLEITDGLLREPSGGTIAFDVTIPAYGQNNTEVTAELNGFDIGTLLTAVPIRSLPDSFRDLRADTSGNLRLTGLPNEMQGEAGLSAKEGTLNGRTFDEIEMRIGFDGKLVTLEKLDAGFGDGRLTAEGTYRTDTRTFDLTADGTAVPVSRILAFVPRNSKVPEAEGDVSLKADIRGTVDDPKSYDIDFSGGSDRILINGNSFGRVTFSGKTENNLLTARLTSRVGSGEQIVTATADLSDENVPLSATTTLSGTQLGPYIAIFRKPDPERVALSGSASGEVRMSGNLVARDADGKTYFTTDGLKGTAALTQFTLLIGETPVEATQPVNLTFDLNRVTVDNARFAGGGTNLTVNGTKALTDNAVNDLALNGRIDLRVLNALSTNVFFSGVADVQMILSGVNKTARLNGRSTLERGSVATFLGSERITLEGLKGCVLFNTSQIQIGCNDGSREDDEIVGRLGGGRVAVTGGVLLTDDLLIEQFRLRVEGNSVTAPLPTNFVTTGNADLEISGRRANGEFTSIVSGTFFARRSTYTRDIDLADFVSGRRDTSLAQSSDDASLFAETRLDIRILGRDALVIRNNIADLTASADLRVTGNVEVPQISGRITANGGTIFFRDDRYEVQRGVLTFPPNTVIEPVINLQAESEIRGYQVFVTLSGNLTDTESLTATLRSNPSLPQADVVSLITTGSLSNTGTGIPTYAQGGLNTAAEILTDEIINKPITRATDKLFGLNRFNLDPIVSGQRGNATARLTVGRQINRNLLVTYSTNLSQDQNQVLALEYRVSNRLSFVAQYEQRPLTSVVRNRNNFSFEIRLRKRF